MDRKILFWIGKNHVLELTEFTPLARVSTTKINNYNPSRCESRRKAHGGPEIAHARQQEAVLQELVQVLVQGMVPGMSEY